MKNLIEQKLLLEMTNFEIQDGGEQRTVGDIIEFKVKNILMSLSDDENIKKCLEPRSKKSIEDVTVIDNDDIKYYIDTKSHNVDSSFSMPNLTSVEKLRKLLLSKNGNLIYVFVSYRVSDKLVNIESIDVKYVWELSFDMLRVGSLGKGQLQISNMNKAPIFTNIGKTEWFSTLKSIVRKYHDDRIKMIEKDKLKWV
jgi:hypothetical protein